MKASYISKLFNCLIQYFLYMKKTDKSISRFLINNYDIAIVGAGPSGMIAAIESSGDKTKTVLIERMYKPALKLRISGKGRCNITNIAETDEFINKFGKNGRFLRQSFNRFFNNDLIEYFKHLGVEFKLERGGRYYPESGDANRIVSALIDTVKKKNVEIVTELKVIKINKDKSGIFEIELLKNKKNGYEQNDPIKITAKKLLMATGGKSYPATGSDGSGFNIAEKLGHSIMPLIPALVPLKGGNDIPLKLNNLSFKNCNISIFSGDKKVEEKFGEIEFRDNEIAGPVVLLFSKNIVQRIKKREKITLSIDFKPALSHPKLDKRILREIVSKKNRIASDIIKTLLPVSAVNFFLHLTGIESEKRADQITASDRNLLRKYLKDLRIPIKGSTSFSKALVTSGGVSLKEINAKTMESMINNGLYFAGEILDLDAITGGYNLQAAFSTGWVAGRSIKSALSE